MPGVPTLAPLIFYAEGQTSFSLVKPCSKSQPHAAACLTLRCQLTLRRPPRPPTPLPPSLFQQGSAQGLVDLNLPLQLSGVKPEGGGFPLSPWRVQGGPRRRVASRTRTKSGSPGREIFYFSYHAPNSFDWSLRSLSLLHTDVL